MLPITVFARSSTKKLTAEVTELQSDGTILERAFELAKSGDYTTSAAIRVQLKKERFTLVQEHLEGASIRKQLIALIQAEKR